MVWYLKRESFVFCCIHYFEGIGQSHLIVVANDTICVWVIAKHLSARQVIVLESQIVFMCVYIYACMYVWVCVCLCVSWSHLGVQLPVVGRVRYFQFKILPLAKCMDTILDLWCRDLKYTWTYEYWPTDCTISNRAMCAWISSNTVCLSTLR